MYFKHGISRTLYASLQADILMVTDGEIPRPSPDVSDKLRLAKETLGLEVHGLLVGRHASEALAEFASHVHTFKAWDSVTARGQSQW